MHKVFLTAIIVCTLSPSARAVQVCDLNGQSVSPYNGSTTASKTGLMRCREGENGPVVREQELRDGVFMGVVRYYREGILQREYSVNERGNRDGIAREFAATAGSTNPLLSEENMRNGSTVGRSRNWLANGKLKRVAFHGDDGRELAMAAFTPQGLLNELRCAPRPLLAPDLDDAKLCGHDGGAPTTVALHRENGAVQARLMFERGERRKSETLWDGGQLREQQEITASGGVERNFSVEGVKRREVQWVTQPDGARNRRVTTLEQEFHASGTLVSERRWRATERGGELQLEQAWYLNGQPKEKREYLGVENQVTRRETRFHDNGRVASEGLWLVKGRYDTLASGVHKQFDDAGRLRREQHYDSKGRVSRERELDESGRVVRDDELFEDGSRKSLSR